MVPIRMQDIIKINNPNQYKLHLACSNGKEHPLDVFVADRNGWLGWNRWRGNQNDWTREFVFSLMEFYPRKDSWLFGGIFRVMERHENGYELEEIKEYEKYVGRLILSFHRYQGMRRRAFRLENFINKFELSEVLPSYYTGVPFPGFENICHDFHMLEPIFKLQKSDWKEALSRIKGIYVISDKENGKQYVGAAYGDEGIWSRWTKYIGTGHGGNKELISLIDDKSIEYARKNLHFSLVEIMQMTTTDDSVLKREVYWKDVLLSRLHGYNHN